MDDAVPPSEPGKQGSGRSQSLLAFAVDEPTLKAIEGVSPGLKRGVDLFEGGIAAAIETVQGGKRPSLLVVDISDSDAPIPPMTALLAAVDPSCTIVALGAKNDITLYRSLTKIGVTDYLVKPIDPTDLRRCLLAAETTDDRADIQIDGRLITVTGARGGSGASAIALGIAQHLSAGGKNQVAFVDLDVYFGTLALTLDLEPGRGLRNALEHPDRIDSLFVASALVNLSDSLFVLGGEEPLDDVIYIQPDSIVMLNQELRRIFDIVVLDLPRHLVPYSDAIFADAQSTALVSDLSLAGLRDVMRIREMIKVANPSSAPLIIGNRVGFAKHVELDVEGYCKTLGGPLDAAFLEDPKAAKELLNGKQFDPRVAKTKEGLTLGDLSRKLNGQDVGADADGKGWLSRTMNVSSKIPRLSGAS